MGSRERQLTRNGKAIKRKLGGVLVLGLGAGDWGWGWGKRHDPVPYIVKVKGWKGHQGGVLLFLVGGGWTVSGHGANSK